MADPDHLTLTVKLTTEEFLEAARLGGLYVAIHKDALDPNSVHHRMLQLFAECGVRYSIPETFQRHYPQVYPDDYVALQSAMVLPHEDNGDMR